MANSIPYKYRRPGVLHEILLIAIRDNWERIRYYYNDVYEWLGANGQDRDIDKALLVRFRKDIMQDGPFFIDTPDGVGGRLKDWLIEAFPHAFDAPKSADNVSFRNPYEKGGIYEDDDTDSLLNDDIVRKW